MPSDEVLFCKPIAETMSRERFEWILRCLHIVDNRIVATVKESSEYDAIVKTRGLLESELVLIYCKFSHPSKFLSVDER